MSKTLSLFSRRRKVPQPNPYELPRIAFSRCAMGGCGAHYPKRRNRWFCWTHQMVLFGASRASESSAFASPEDRTPVVQPKVR
jgi:hypothetical protein